MRGKLTFRTRQLNPEITLVETGYLNEGPDKELHPVLWVRVEFCERERAIELTKRLWLKMLTEE